MRASFPDGRIPPYVPYRTFLTFLDSLRGGMPSHVDKSVLTSMSGAVQSWLKTSLRAMGLIDRAGVPQERLCALVTAEGQDRNRLLREIFESTYGFLSKDVDLQSTTPARLEAAFVAAGASGDTVRKAVAFMLSLARDAGIELSPHLSKPGALPRPGRPPARKRAGGEGTGLVPDHWVDRLVQKFPEFDPAWPDELKAKWFDGFDRLVDARKRARGDRGID
jgi:hypothetical protein